MKIDGETSVAKIAAELPGARGVFESFGLDYACTGDRSIEDAAHAEGLDVETVIAALHRIKTAEHVQTWNDRPLVDLTRYLASQHHRFIHEEMASLAMRLSEVCSSRVGAREELLSIRSSFSRLSDVLLPHLRREEENVFPAVEALESAWNSGERPPTAAGAIAAQIRQLTLEHATIAAQLRTMRELRLRLTSSDELTPQCRAILVDCAALEAHLHELVFLENSITFPRLLALEREVSSSTKEKR